MRILYAVNAYGRGHATRALGVLPHLMKHHEVMVLAGGDAYDTLHLAGVPTTPIPGLAYVYGRDGRACIWRSLLGNASSFADLARTGPELRRVIALARGFAPDVAIVDAEPWVHKACAQLRIPRISFDHYGILLHCQCAVPPRDRLWIARDRAAYRLAIGRPERIIVSSFYTAPPRVPGVRMVGPVLRAEILAQKPVRRDFLLAYLNHGDKQLVPHVEKALRALDLPVVLYGCKRVGRDGNLDFRAPANEGFLQDLASCRAVFSTGGNQLVGEAIHLGKPLLVMPEDTIEQRINALAVEQMGIGMQVDLAGFGLPVLREFLARELELRGRLRSAARNGCAEAVEALETYAAELAPRRPTRGAHLGLGDAA
jgi:uncharacterized protein (TIGR00661 family)